ncbi:NYN domain-containing protein [Entomospira entomophila]|uniref:NYN domain-containing protein n=1 Tax=Entomospira entomophila TaxID=2719988 RepID=A0A968KSG8_9SPIO|nr:NYN domain-containing protein [Entomospira entomophilus]NIZ40337.1 NYN domain-containing protein [Entomospira entomophilus]WDI35896.1 NYN domain-containing protein [Entomospira entomophilus]
MMKKEMPSGVAILWDIENITPPNSDTLLMDGITEFAEAFGRISVSFAYADWSVPKFAKLSRSLSERQFRLTHTPHKGGNGGKGKNSADMALVSDAMELLQFYDHISIFIVVTGDSDFRPLLQTIRKNGKMIHVIYDIKRAPQDLLALADGFTDYRDLISSKDDEEDEEEGTVSKVKQSREYWFQQVAEAADILKNQGKNTTFGSVKIQMKILNRDFNESSLGFKRFSHFIMAASSAGYVSIQSGEGGSREIVSRPSYSRGGANAPGSLQAALTALDEELAKLDDSKEDEEHDGWHGYNHIGILLSKRDINIQELGFSRLKKFIQNAEVRGIVETRIHEDGYPYVRRAR